MTQHDTWKISQINDKAGRGYDALPYYDESYKALCARIDALLQSQSHVIVAIDGHCTAGKTTLAATLANEYECNVFHMDDFFLRPEQRTKERYEEIGGNVDYERFNEEVLKPLVAHKSFTYRIYDCSKQNYGAVVHVEDRKLSIVEGSYCMHPKLVSAYNLTVYMQITPELQRKRILERSPKLHERFFTEWIPLEQKYIEGTSLAQRSDMIISAL